MVFLDKATNCDVSFDWCQDGVLDYDTLKTLPASGS